MIKALIKSDNNKIKSIVVNGHANYANSGKDIVCAGVTAIMVGALNAIDILYNDQATLNVLENEIQIIVKSDSNELQKTLEFVKIQLKTIFEQYPTYFELKEI
ncbi:ribosomal-processing cysteine protease Prp [Spiroplasma endosymbiont of Crioceris asparagi]|uniref:ribosomal-processing cysteine protease Prp n=1 Tax=Spiroplasma endosymbiont of Crioceris asparagi TaxID=3066286 RepID=UPI0030D3CF60